VSKSNLTEEPTVVVVVDTTKHFLAKQNGKVTGGMSLFSAPVRVLIKKENKKQHL